MRAVVDSNVFITALLRGPTPQRIYDAFLNGRFTLLFSQDTLAELLDVLSRPKFRTRISRMDVDRLVTAIRQDAILLRTTGHVSACRDPKDDIFLDCALAGDADCLVTGDRDLLTLHPFRGIRILRPADFLRLLK